MNSDKQAAPWRMRSIGAAPVWEPAAAAPQCRCRHRTRAPSPAQNITAAIRRADLTGTGFLRLRTSPPATRSRGLTSSSPYPSVPSPESRINRHHRSRALSDDVAIACPAPLLLPGRKQP